MTAIKRKPTPAEIEILKARLAGMSHEEKVQLATRTKPIMQQRGHEVKRRDKTVPKTDDELHAYIIEKTGFNIPRVAVCPDHQAPFDFITDGYFERESALFQVGSREMGKTLGVSILHFINSETKPRCESITFGAIEAQAKRAYTHVKSFIFVEEELPDGSIRRELRPGIKETLRSETGWETGSKVEIIVGSKSGVNSPHSQKVHADEVDLMEREVWDESRNMSSSKKLPDGTWIMAQDYGTSTRKSMHGIVQEILDSVEEAQKQGLEPPWKVYISCIFEAAEEAPHCRAAPEDQRRARLTELGRDPCELCNCDKVVRGEWSEDNPRTLETVCKGKFFRSRGWMLHSDVKRKFRQNTQAVWEAQMECRRAMVDGLYLEHWTRQRFTVIGWIPDARFGNVWTGTDWGGSAESAILWVQGPLRMPVRIMGPMGMIEIPKDAYVVFDELLAANTGATKLADMVVDREMAWRRKVRNFRVTARFCDMAGKQQRDDWREHTPPLRTVTYLPNRDFDPTVKTLQDLVDDKRYWVDTQCSRHQDDIESWRQKNGKEVHDETSHTMAASRYLHANAEAIQRRRQHKKQENNVKPAVVQRAQPTNMGVVVTGGGHSDFAGERAWRSQLGGPPIPTR